MTKSHTDKFSLLVRLPVFVSLVCLTFSCTDDAVVTSYQIKPEYDGPVVTWILPNTWIENPDLSGPMAGSFQVKSPQGPTGRIGVMPFRESVSSLEVANMFAREIGYGNLNEKSLAPLIEKKTLGNREFEWIRLEEQSPEKSARTILLALFRQNSETWLFPFIAEKSTVDRELGNFSSFLQSTVLRAGQEKIKARTNPAGTQQSTVASAPPPNVPNWKIPTHWVAGSASSIRLASYKVIGDDGNELDFSVTSFPGDVGGLLANVNRWLGQIDMAAIDAQSLKNFVQPITIDGHEAQLVEAFSNQQAFIAAILIKGNRSWFFKISGSALLAEEERNNFSSFLQSISFGKS